MNFWPYICTRTGAGAIALISVHGRSWVSIDPEYLKTRIGLVSTYNGSSVRKNLYSQASSKK